ncbi:MAG: EscU/YscU/HrcU family type III secretion system export apparatus switch protein, partial [Nitrospiria bacterium]
MPFDDQEKTEQATPKRRDEAQKKGQVVTSRELSSASIILVGAAALHWFGPQIVSGLKANMVKSYVSLSSAPMNNLIFTTIMRDGMWTLLTLMVPIVGLVTLAGVISPVLQHGFVWTMTPILPDWHRVDPISGFGKILSIQGLVNGLKTLLKFLVVGGVA